MAVMIFAWGVVRRWHDGSFMLRHVTYLFLRVLLSRSGNLVTYLPCPRYVRTFSRVPWMRCFLVYRFLF